MRGIWYSQTSSGSTLLNKQIQQIQNNVKHYIAGLNSIRAENCVNKLIPLTSYSYNCEAGVASESQSVAQYTYNWAGMQKRTLV